MKQKFAAIVGSVVSYIIAMLGFASCSSDDVVEYMYGTPHADFQVSGLVTGEEDAPVNKARVIVRPYGYGDGQHFLNEHDCDTLTTDIAGKYEGQITSFPSDKIVIVCEDPQGGYETDSIEVKPKYENGSNNWFLGVATAEVNFKLKKAGNKEGK